MHKYNTSVGRIYLWYLFEHLYGRKLFRREAENIAENLLALGKVIEEFYSKKKKIHGKSFDEWLKRTLLIMR